MNRIWIKLYLEILDDPKMGRLPDHLWRRSVELFLMAGRNGNDGTLPAVEEIAWGLRSSVDEVLECLSALAQVGIVRKGEDGLWVVSSFEKRQYSESYERVKRYRNAKSNGESNEGDTSLSSSSSSSNSSSYSEEGGGTGEGTIPTTPKEAAQNPEIRLYEKITGGFPGERNYRTIIETIQYLREKHGAELEDYLMPYWTAWSTRKTKDHKPYSPKSLVWMCEWAMQGDIPKTNGHEPKAGESSDHKQKIISKVVQNAKR